MALVLKDRVKVTATTTGTGTITLGTAPAGYQNFSVIGTGNTTYYTIALQSGNEWEVGIGTVTDTAGTFTLSRTTVFESSNAGSLVNFSAGTKDVFVTYPAERAVYLDAAGSAVPVLDIGTLGVSTANITTANITSGTVSTAPVSNTDIVNKQYADAIASGIHFHEAVGLATTAALPANTYNNGTSGVGATLTGNANGALSVDSTLTIAAERILVKNESAGANNGVYTVTQVGSAGTPYILTRATDFDSVGSGVNEIDEGDFFLVTGGTANINTAWVQQTPPPITIGTTALVFQQFSAPITYTAGTGLNESPTYTFNIANTGTAGTYGSASQVPVFVTNAQGQVTSVTNTAIGITSAAVSGLAASATTDATDATNITSGTLPTARLNGSYTGITGTGALAAGSLASGFTAVSAPLGGTGFSSYAVGDLLYADTTTTLAKLPDVAVGNALISGGVSAAPTWGKIGLATHVDGTLPATNGGTGLTSFTANGIPYASTTTTLTTGSALGFNGTDLLNTGAYTAPNNGAGAGQVVQIRGATGTGQANASGGNGFIQLLGAGGTNSWTTFIGSTARRRGGINLQAGTAQVDAGGTYVSGSQIEIRGSNGTNNGTNTGFGSTISLTSGSVTKIDTFTSNGSIITANGATFSGGGTTSFVAGSFNISASISTSGAFTSFAGGSASQGGGLNITAGSYSGTTFFNSGSSISVGGSSATSTGNITLSVASAAAGSTNGKISLVIGSTEIVQVGPTGAIGLSGANYGTAGQVLMSSGPSYAPTWQCAGGGGCATPTVAGNVYGQTQTCGAGNGVALGYSSDTGAGSGNIAIGFGASGGSGGSISIGYYAAGSYPFYQGTCSISIGTGSRTVSPNGIAIGTQAAAQSGGIAIGTFATANNACSIVIGAYGFSCCAGVYISHVRNVTGATYLGYNACTKEITYSAGNPSDINLKENIQPIGCALSKTAQIRGVTFDWKACGKNAIGVIAQEVEAVFPQLVTLEGDGYKTVKYDNMVAVLVEAVKELKTRVEALELNLQQGAST